MPFEFEHHIDVVSIIYNMAQYPATTSSNCTDKSLSEVHWLFGGSGEHLQNPSGIRGCRCRESIWQCLSQLGLIGSKQEAMKSALYLHATLLELDRLRISTGLVESTVNGIMVKRMVKKR